LLLVKTTKDTILGASPSPASIKHKALIQDFAESILNFVLVASFSAIQAYRMNNVHSAVIPNGGPMPTI
jgi:hypothetical protein